MPKKRGKFWKEVKRQVRLSVTAAIGFIIAFAWKDSIIQFVGSFFDDIRLAFPIASHFLTAIILTVIGVSLILISARLLE